MNVCDIDTRLEARRRVRELEELAETEGITLPLPAAWIAGLEAAGYMVDLVNGMWESPEGVIYMPTTDARVILATTGLGTVERVHDERI